LNIGVDATCWWNNRGFGRFTRELLSEIFVLGSSHTFYLFSDQPIADVARFDNVVLVTVASSKPTTEAAVANDSRSLRDMFRLSRAVAKAPLDIMYFHAVYSWFPVPMRLPTMLTVMDAIAEHFPKLIFPDWRSRLFWTIKMKAAVWSSRRVLTISNAAKEEIVEYIGIDADKIDVCSAAPNPEFVQTFDSDAIALARQNAGLPPEVPIIVYVGGLAPHKNLHGLLDGFEKAQARCETLHNVHLALVGDFDGAGFFSNYDSLQERVEGSAHLRGKVHFAGFVSDDDLIGLYSSALAIAMPSYSEGFGLPAIEAMACGAPVLSSDRASLPEVVGNAGVYFDPYDAQSISDAIVTLAQDDELRARLSANGLVRAKTFTWSRAAQLALQHIENMARD